MPSEFKKAVDGHMTFNIRIIPRPGVIPKPTSVVFDQGRIFEIKPEGFIAKGMFYPREQIQGMIIQGVYKDKRDELILKVGTDGGK